MDVESEDEERKDEGREMVGVVAGVVRVVEWGDEKKDMHRKGRKKQRRRKTQCVWVVEVRQGDVGQGMRELPQRQ